MLLAAKDTDATASSITNAYIEAAEQMLIDDVQDNQSIGEFGAKWLLENTEAATAAKGISILTHCNTGYVAISSLFRPSESHCDVLLLSLPTSQSLKT